MSSMAYPYPQPNTGVPGAGFNQIIKRPMTDAERQLPANFYKAMQNGVRALAIVCLVLFIVNTYLLSSIVTDPTTYDTLSIMMAVFMLVFGAASIGMAINSVVLRGKIAGSMREGVAIEVTGPAYRSSGPGKVQGWTIGPISMLPSRDIQGIIQEGMPTKVLCLPKLKAALAVNASGLKHGARIMCPPNLEAMAVTTMQPTMPTGQPPLTQYPAYGQAAPQAQPSLWASDDYLPPPPPPE